MSRFLLYFIVDCLETTVHVSAALVEVLELLVWFEVDTKVQFVLLFQNICMSRKEKSEE